MEVNKGKPWFMEEKGKELFRLTNEEIEFALAEREKLDYDHGIRFRGDTVREREWVVGFAEGSLEVSEYSVRRYIDELRGASIEKIFAIPASSPSYEHTSAHEVVQFFDPPLIALASATDAGFDMVASSGLSTMNGAYYLFPPNLTSAALIVTGYYAMFAGPRVLVEAAIRCEIRESWQSVVAPDRIDPLLLYRLRSAMVAYGLA